MNILLVGFGAFSRKIGTSCVFVAILKDMINKYAISQL
jgi:hypothetical protein